MSERPQTDHPIRPWAYRLRPHGAFGLESIEIDGWPIAAWVWPRAYRTPARPVWAAAYRRQSAGVHTSHQAAVLAALKLIRADIQAHN